MDQTRFQAEVERELSATGGHRGHALLDDTDTTGEQYSGGLDTTQFDDDAGEATDLADEAAHEEYGRSEAFAPQNASDDAEDYDPNNYADQELAPDIEEALRVPDTEEFFRRLVDSLAGNSDPHPHATTSRRDQSQRRRQHSGSGAARAHKGRFRAQTKRQDRPERHVLHMLQRHSRAGFDERESLQELAYECSQQPCREAITVLAGLAARLFWQAIPASARRSLPDRVRRETARSALRALHMLLKQGEPAAVRRWPRIALRVADRIARGSVKPRDVPETIYETAMQAMPPSGRSSVTVDSDSLTLDKPQREFRPVTECLVLHGPVEIHIISRRQRSELS